MVDIIGCAPLTQTPSWAEHGPLRGGCSGNIAEGALLPLLVSGSVVVENVFSLPGMGSLAYGAVMNRDQGMVMALTLLVSTVTLSGLLLSDVLHRVVDPRVKFS